MSLALSSAFTEAGKLVEHIVQPYLIDQHIPAPLQKAMTKSMSKGGKRLRPTLALIFANLLKVPEVQVARVAAAIELVHCYSLIHDDLPCMDNADIRRGQPSCWREFGEATAILAGDSLMPLAFEVLSDEATHPCATVRLSLVKALAQDLGGAGMAGGQMLDLSPKLIDCPQEAILMQSLKTGCLIAFSCEAGAILAQASLQHRQHIRHFGFLFGLAYQMQDDLFDIEGDAASMGKPVGMDTGKRSLVMQLGVEKSKQHIAALQKEMSGLIESYREPLLWEIISWISNRDLKQQEFKTSIR
jgi:farnesyl diphosphate synthase